MSLKSNKNLIGSETEYNRYYTGFRGVDFSSDHTQVNEKRLAYLVNMYRDYQTGQGEALETVPGFRKRFVAPNASSIYGIFSFDYRNEQNEVEKHIIVHAGKNLYRWTENINETLNVPLTATIVFDGTETIEGSTYQKQLEGTVSVKDVEYIISATNQSGDSVDIDMFKKKDGDKALYFLSPEKITLNVVYYENLIKETYTHLNAQKSTAFVFNNALYILDGKNYIRYDGKEFKNVSPRATTPLLYQNIQVGENATTGEAYQQANLLDDKGVFTFIADGVTKDYPFPIPVDGVDEVKVYGETSTYKFENNTVMFTTAPKKPTDAGFSDSYAGVEITAILKNRKSDITSCTIAEIYDDRVFFSGNLSYPNRVWFSKLNDPTYFGELDYEQEGVSDAPITAMMTVADSLLVLKGDSEQESTAYFLTPIETNENLKPIAYQSARGLNGVGCLGACRNFLDDPVFVSRLGLEAIGQLSVRLERAKEHRSSLVDAKLVNSNLKEASMCEWGGYLWVLVDGQIFLADSRQRWQNALGNAEYEWYYLNNVAVYDGQWEEYFYVSEVPEYLLDIAGYPLEVKYGYEGKTANEYNSDAVMHTVQAVTVDNQNYYIHVSYVVETDEYGLHYYLVTTKGSKVGGTPHNAKIIASVNDNVYFGTDNGIVCSFNFDQRDKELGTIPTKSYSFDGRTIVSGCATLMDNCGILHLTKSTIKRSTVIKTKAFSRSAAKVRVRTNKNPYKQIARIINSSFSFDDVDFSDFTFITTDQTLYSIKEKEKHWVEKQYYVYSDEYCSPFALYYISYRFKVAGRLKT